MKEDCEVVECRDGDAFLRRTRDGAAFVHPSNGIAEALALLASVGKAPVGMPFVFVMDDNGRFFVGAEWLAKFAEQRGKPEAAIRTRKFVAACVMFLDTDAETN